MIGEFLDARPDEIGVNATILVKNARKNEHT